MEAPFRALIWEQWRRTRWAWVTVFAASTAVSEYFFHSPRLPIPAEFRISEALSLDFRSYSMILYLLVLFLPLDGSDVKLGLPRYMMTLPCRTRTLAIAQLGYGMVSTALLALANEFVAACFAANPVWELAVLDMSLLALLYALFWTLGVGAPRPTLVIATATAMSAVYFHFMAAEAKVNALLPETALAIVAVGVASRGIGLDRNGEIAPGCFVRREESRRAFFWRLLCPNCIASMPGLRPLFTMEWRRTYRYIPMITAPVALVWSLALPGLNGLGYHGGYRNSALFESVYTMCAWVLPLICGMTGLLRDTWEYRAYRAGTVSPESCRPVSDRTLTAARWLAGAAAIGLGQLLLLPILVVTVWVSGESVRFQNGQMLGLLMGFVILAITQVAISWTLLWFSPLTLLAALYKLGNLPHSVALFLLCVFAGLGILVITPMAIRRHAVSTRLIVVVLCCWAAVSIPWHELLAPLRHNRLLPDEMSLAGAMMALIGCLTLIWTPLSVHTMRHRR